MIPKSVMPPPPFNDALYRALNNQQAMIDSRMATVKQTLQKRQQENPSLTNSMNNKISPYGGKNQ